MYPSFTQLHHNISINHWSRASFNSSHKNLFLNLTNLGRAFLECEKHLFLCPIFHSHYFVQSFWKLHLARKSKYFLNALIPSSAHRRLTPWAELPPIRGKHITARNHFEFHTLDAFLHAWGRGWMDCKMYYVQPLILGILWLRGCKNFMQFLKSSKKANNIFTIFFLQVIN